MGKTVASQKKQQRRIYGDRFMPMRVGNKWRDQTPLRPESLGPGFSKSDAQEFLASKANQTNEPKRPNLYAELLNNEVFPTGSGANKSLFRYRQPTVSTDEAILALGSNPLTPKTRNSLMLSRIRKLEEIPKQNCLALTAPGIVDNFYYNLLDWSYKNVISLGLDHEVYTKKAFTPESAELCTLVGEQGSEVVSSVKYNERGDILAIGSSQGTVQIFDVNRQKPIKFAHNHVSTAMSIAWQGNSLVSGDSDGFIFQSDFRCPIGSAEERLLNTHSKVCNLKFSPDGQYLASSGGDGRVCIWTNRFLRKPIRIIDAHQSSVKALDWCPHEYGTLATGGGHRDTTIRIWNVLTGIEKYSTITGAQVCNLAWSPNESKLVTTHGFGSYSIKVWDYPSMKMVSNLEGHECRVQYMAMSPHGEGIVTGGSDETVRFWKVFSTNKISTKRVHAKLNLFSQIR